MVSHLLRYFPQKLFHQEVYSCALYIVISPYCDTATAPTIANANSPTTDLTVYGTTSFTCNFGYASSGGTINPYYTCDPFNSTNGMWAAVLYGCECAHTLLVNSFTEDCTSGITDSLFWWPIVYSVDIEPVYWP